MCAVYLSVWPADPCEWTRLQVLQWLRWAVQEFSLEGVVADRFAMSGAQLIQLGREEFFRRSPPFVGDILLEHLEILQKGEKTDFVWRVCFWIRIVQKKIRFWTFSILHYFIIFVESFKLTYDYAFIVDNSVDE